MQALLAASLENLLSPAVLFFGLGLLATWFKTGLEVHEAISKALSLFLMVAIGFKGGAELSHAGLDTGVLLGLFASVGLALALPAIAFALLRLTTSVARTDAAAIAAHYGSVSMVTFITATSFLEARQLSFEGHLVAMLALMETPAIIAGLLLAKGKSADMGQGALANAGLLGGGRVNVVREALFSGSVLLLLGSLAIGYATGERGLTLVSPFFVDPMQGVLCLFLLDMGLVTARRLTLGSLSLSLLAFGLWMPLLGAGLGLLTAWALGFSVGSATLLAVLSGSASYIVVPAAMRVALPAANPGLSMTLSLGVTFPFNLLLGIPLYFYLAEQLVG